MRDNRCFAPVIYKRVFIVGKLSKKIDRLSDNLLGQETSHSVIKQNITQISKVITQYQGTLKNCTR